MSAVTDVGSARTDLLRQVAAATAGAVGEEYLQEIVKRIGTAFGGGVCWVSEMVDPGVSARALACHPSAALPAGMEYPLEGTPCQYVHERAVVAFPERVDREFPDDAFLTDHDLQGYIAVGIHDSEGNATGYLALTTHRRLDPDEDELAALRIFATRIGAELERRRQERRIREREAEIVASRARVVAAADEERRRIGRDLHDGVQQRLVALIQRLDLASRHLGSDSEMTAEMLVAAREQAAAAGQELRELSHGLHPVGLSERGLEGALRQLAARSTLALDVVELPARRLPQPIELTIYYIVSEALTNAVKHAQATVLQARAVLVDNRALELYVDDDGVGGATDGGGSGLRGLSDRVAALGGTLDIDSPPGGGTHLRASIPLAPFRDARDPFIEFGHEGDGGAGVRSIEQVMDGTKSATISLAREWDQEGGPPAIGQVLPIRDHRGKEYCRVVVTHTSTMPFHLVDDTLATVASGEPTTVSEWRANRYAFYEGCRDEIAVILSEPDWRLTDAEPVVVTHFRLM